MLHACFFNVTNNTFEHRHGNNSHNSICFHSLLSLLLYSNLEKYQLCLTDISILILYSSLLAQLCTACRRDYHHQAKHLSHEDISVLVTYKICFHSLQNPQQVDYGVKKHEHPLLHHFLQPFPSISSASYPLYVLMSLLETKGSCRIPPVCFHLGWTQKKEQSSLPSTGMEKKQDASLAVLEMPCFTPPLH